jgi:hypothetical protein
MSIEAKRGIKSAQPKMRMLQVEVDGNAATPAASGFDKLQIKEVVDNGVGDYTIILKRPFNAENANKAKAIVGVLEPDRAAHMYASSHDRVSIRCTDLAGVAAESAISVMIIGCDMKYQL